MKDKKKRTHDIAVLLATHKRTDALSRSIDSLVDHARDLSSIQFILGIDDNDDIGINHFSNVIQPRFDSLGITYQALLFEPLGYLGLNKYYNSMARAADADWLWVWCDDAICETQDWDDRIRECTGEFRLLKVHTHNEHPYSIFPIFPTEWFEHLGYLSQHQLIDTESSHLAFYHDIMKVIEIDVTHDRADLTGNNKDENANKKKYLEGNPGDPRDFYHVNFKAQRSRDMERLKEFMDSQGVDTSWYQGVKEGKNNPYDIMKRLDPNNQCGMYEVVRDQNGQLRMRSRDAK